MWFKPQIVKLYQIKDSESVINFSFSFLAVTGEKLIEADDITHAPITDIEMEVYEVVMVSWYYIIY